jgi:hypothetical protein
VIGVPFLLSLGFVASPAGAAGTIPCNSGYNPFEVGASLLEQCHEPVFTRQGATALPDGGTEYQYNVEGTRILYRTPPAGFDPTTASDATLDFYGLPHPPADVEGYVQWSSEMSRLHWVPAPPYLTVLPHLVTGPRTTLSVKDPDGGGGSYSNDWGGYEAYGAPSTFNEVAGMYYEPSLDTTACPSGAEGNWVGLGGDPSLNGDKPLAQAGTGYNISPNIATHEGFYEFVDSFGNGKPLPAAWTSHAGDSVYVQVKYNGDGTYTFSWIDNTTALVYTSVAMAGQGYGGASAEWINERPLGASQLAKFYYVNWTQEVANNVNLADTHYTTESITTEDQSTSDFLDEPNPSNGGDVSTFTDWWKNCA